jgi:hypothetical protein
LKYGVELGVMVRCGVLVLDGRGFPKFGYGEGNGGVGVEVTVKVG